LFTKTFVNDIDTYECFVCQLLFWILFIRSLDYDPTVKNDLFYDQLYDLLW